MLLHAELNKSVGTEWRGALKKMRKETSVDSQEKCWKQQLHQVWIEAMLPIWITCFSNPIDSQRLKKKSRWASILLFGRWELLISGFRHKLLNASIYTLSITSFNSSWIELSKDWVFIYFYFTFILTNLHFTRSSVYYFYRIWIPALPLSILMRKLFILSLSFHICKMRLLVPTLEDCLVKRKYSGGRLPAKSQLYYWSH